MGDTRNAHRDDVRRTVCLRPEAAALIDKAIALANEAKRHQLRWGAGIRFSEWAKEKLEAAAKSDIAAAAAKSDTARAMSDDSPRRGRPSDTRRRRSDKAVRRG